MRWRCFLFAVEPCTLHDLSSLIRDRTQLTSMKALGPNHWTTQGIPQRCFLRVAAGVLTVQTVLQVLEPVVKGLMGSRFDLSRLEWSMSFP